MCCRELILEMLDSERIEQDKKRNEYMSYIKQHISNVSKSYNDNFMPLLNNTHYPELDDAINKAGINIQYHDASKYSKEEFELYRKRFFPTDQEKKHEDINKQLFEKAWIHHHQNNPHHLEHWSTLTDKRDMPLEYIIEMLCDWSSMSMYFNSSTREWYETEAQSDEALYMTPYTREWTERFLHELTPNIK